MSFIKVNKAIHKETKKELFAYPAQSIDQKVKKSFDPVIKNWVFDFELIWE